MTIRGAKRLVLAALVLVGLAAIVGAVNAFLPGGKGVSDLTDCLPALFFLFLLSTMWNRLSRLEAEHGPDYVQPTAPYARTLLVIAIILAVVLAVMAFLIVR
jgi:hypothetical protein